MFEPVREHIKHIEYALGSLALDQRVTARIELADLYLRLEMAERMLEALDEEMLQQMVMRAVKELSLP